MLLSTLEELRLYAPANAIDHIETLAGFLQMSEYDFLRDKLGEKLYNAVTGHYARMRKNALIDDYVEKVALGYEMSAPDILLTLCQRVITFDALSRAAGMQAVSVNAAGINIAVASDYQKPDKDLVNTYISTCVREAHAAVNTLLTTLEDWTREQGYGKAGSAKKEITDAWRGSRYFYLAASRSIPSASILQEYLDIRGSREKFIAMLPDIKAIEDYIIAPIIGEDMLSYLISVAGGLSAQTAPSDVVVRLVHKLRSAVARHLESRMEVMKVSATRRTSAHNEAVRLTTDLADMIVRLADKLPAEGAAAYRLSPLYDNSDDTVARLFSNNAEGSVMFVTPTLD